MFLKFISMNSLHKHKAKLLLKINSDLMSMKDVKSM